MTGDTVIGKQAESDCITRHVRRRPVAANSTLRLSLPSQMVQIVPWRFPLAAEALMSTWEIAAVLKYTQRKVRTDFLPAPSLETFSSVFPLTLLSYLGAVCVRVPSSLKAGVELCGASLEISPEVVMRRVETSRTEGQTTFTGVSLFFIGSHSKPSEK